MLQHADDCDKLISLPPVEWAKVYIESERNRDYFKLCGMKLALGIADVTVYRIAKQSSTSIELFR